VDRARLLDLLTRVASGGVSTGDALEQLARLPFEDLGFARVDHHRALRCGFPEVIFGQGKDDAQLCEIFVRLAASGVNVLATRVSASAAALAQSRIAAADYDPLSRTLVLRQRPRAARGGLIAICAAGTADLPVAEEARRTAEIMDQRVETFYDVGVAGIHRLLAQSERLRQAHVVVVAAGMEGALPSVVGGLVRAPVIAVPTSVGYGASFGGIAALLAMLNSCAAGVSVVNIDNGFAAGYQAALISGLVEADAAPRDVPAAAQQEHARHA
jgi:hypothetical protein